MVGGDYGLGVPTSRRETQRAKQNKRDRKKQTPLQDQTPADVYARALFLDNGTALADLREAVSTLEEVSPIVRRVLGSAHPEVANTEKNLKASRAVLRAREASAGT